MKAFVILATAILWISSQTGPVLAQEIESQEQEQKVENYDEQIQRLEKRIEILEIETLEREKAQQDPIQNSTQEERPWPVKLKVSITVRYDSTELEDQTDLLLEDNAVEGLRTKNRFTLEYNPDGRVAAGIRLSTGEDPNPTSPFIRLGNAFRIKSFELDQFYIVYRPLKHFYPDLSFTVGKMPRPFWLGGRGPFRTEMIWDTDVNPEGAVFEARLPTLFPFLQVENTAGYFSIYEVTDNRFSGLTGDTYLLADQLRFQVDIGQLGGLMEPGAVGGTFAATIYDYHNLNAGLRAPNFFPGSGAFVAPATSALLMRSGLQRTNNRVNYGAPGADGFVDGRFTPLNLTTQLHLAIPTEWLEPLGLAFLEPEVFWLGDYVKNLSVSEDERGFSITGGLRGGGKGFISPFNIWYTYREVDADATLATFADSDLGAGTGYEGFEFVVNYRLRPDLMFQFLYLDFEGFPNKDNGVTRMFFDLVRTF